MILLYAPTKVEDKIVWKRLTEDNYTEQDAKIIQNTHFQQGIPVWIVYVNQ